MQNQDASSRKLHAALWIIGGIIMLLLVFGAGIVVGHRESLFMDSFGNNYYHIFSVGLPGRPFAEQHGVAGEVIDLTSSTLSVKDMDGDEHSVAILSDTLIREGDMTIAIGSVENGDMVTVIGAPNQNGQIEARFVRVFGASSSAPLPPPPAPGTNFN